MRKLSIAFCKNCCDEDKMFTCDSTNKTCTKLLYFLVDIKDIEFNEDECK